MGIPGSLARWSWGPPSVPGSPCPEPAQFVVFLYYGYDTGGGHLFDGCWSEKKRRCGLVVVADDRCVGPDPGLVGEIPRISIAEEETETRSCGKNDDRRSRVGTIEYYNKNVRITE